MDPLPSSPPSSAASVGAPVVKVTQLSANLVAELLVKPQKTDYSAEVSQLAQDKIWSSIPPETYTPNGKINFLHLRDDGVLVITIFKPNTKPRRIYAKIRPEEVATVLEKLQ